MAHYSIFREELAIAYPTYGSALWEPDPGGQYNAVEVGDVGFIRRGYFQRLFNVLHPRDHPSHRNPSFVPEDHQQLQTFPDHIVKNEIRTGSRQNSLHFSSQYVTLESRGRGTSAAGPEDDSEVTFSCYGKQGALLSLPVPAQGEDTVAFGDFGKWMIKHIDTWFAFARGLGLGISRMEDIILVTGRHLTKSWVNVAFTQRRRDSGVSFDVQVSNHGHVALEQQYVHGGDLKLGPAGRDLPENQCIFIRGFRVVRILGMWPRLRGQAGPAPNAGDDEPGPEFDTQLELIGVPADSNSQDPLRDLLQYIAKQAPDCDMALVHDNDLACIDGVFLKAIRAHKLIEVLPESAPTIQQFQSGLFPGNESSTGDDVAVVNVATLSRHAFETPRVGSNPILIPEASSRPDRAAYEAEQKRIETLIDLLQEELATVKSNVAIQRDSDKNKKETLLRAQLEDLQLQHSSNKISRNEVLEQIETLQHGIQKKETDLQVCRENAMFMTVEDVDTHIRNLEEQVESTRQEIVHARHIRKTVESFQADSDALDADRASVEELKKWLNDPEAKATSEDYDVIEIRVEMDEMEIDDNADSKMFQERHRRQLGEPRESTSWSHENKERHYVKFDKDQVRDAERRHAQREVEYSKKQKARALQLRAGESQPAYQAQIDYCQTLIDYLSSKSIVAGTTTPLHTSPDSIVPLKRRGEEEKDYFIGTKEGRKLKKGPMAHNTFVAEMSSASGVDLPSSSLSALHLLAILPPSSQADVPRVVKDLKVKKAWFEAKRARETMANLKVPGRVPAVRATHTSTVTQAAEPLSGVEAIEVGKQKVLYF